MKAHTRVSHTFQIEDGESFVMTTPTGQANARMVVAHGRRITENQTVEIIGTGISAKDGSPLSIDRRGMYHVRDIPNARLRLALLAYDPFAPTIPHNTH